MTSLICYPLTLEEANDLVRRWHRHHKRAVGHRFSLGCMDLSGRLVGACIVGRAVAPGTDQSLVVEVTRLVTDGTKNACTFLYAAAARVAKEMGFLRIQSFVLESETGLTLESAGWTFVGYTAGGDWNESRGRADRESSESANVRKKKFIKTLNTWDPALLARPIVSDKLAEDLGL